MRSRIQISFLPPPGGSASTSCTRSSWATASGICWRRSEPPHWASDCYPAATVARNSSRRARTALTKIRVTLPGELPQFGGLRGGEIVAYLGGLRGGVDTTRVRAISERLELDLGRRYREYSRGNKQKLGLLVAFMHRPSLLILDEPTASLDPLNQQTFY